jgi:phage-related tail fiber protein
MGITVFPDRESDLDPDAFIQRDGSEPFTGHQSLGNHRLTDVADPVDPQDAVNQRTLDKLLRQQDRKDSCRVATTANLTLSGIQTVDGVGLVAGDRVLVKNQTTGSQNGIYVVAAGAWSRAADCDANAEITAGLTVPIAEGTIHADKTFKLTTNDPITVGTTALVFVAEVTSPSGSGTDHQLTRWDVANGLQDVPGWSASDAGKVTGRSSAFPTVSLTDAATITLDLNAGNHFEVTLGGNRTLALTNATIGQNFTVSLKQDSTGARTVTWWPGIKWPGDTPPTLTTTPNRMDMLGFRVIGSDPYGAICLGFIHGLNFAG